MEKLIKLINEHQREKHKDGFYTPVVAYRDGIFCSDSDCLSWVMDEIHLISKHYGFIKWLVEKDKIDRDKELKENGLFRMYFYDLEYVKNYDRLVMWLSVEDEPIKFLCGIIK